VVKELIENLFGPLPFSDLQLQFGNEVAKRFQFWIGFGIDLFPEGHTHWEAVDVRLAPLEPICSINHDEA
jgi:hypothetical protein